MIRYVRRQWKKKTKKKNKNKKKQHFVEKIHILSLYGQNCCIMDVECIKQHRLHVLNKDTFKLSATQGRPSVSFTFVCNSLDGKNKQTHNVIRMSIQR